MEISNNYSITQLFAKKEITIIVDKRNFIILKIPTLRDFFEDAEWNSTFFLWTRNTEEAQKIYYKKYNNSLDYIKLMIFDAPQFKEYSKLGASYKKYLSKWIKDIEYDYHTHELKVGNVIINNDIWEHILYLLKLTCGEKVVQPPTFNSEEARQLFLAQQEREEKIRRIKSQSENKEGLIQALLAITYAFPSFTIDYLFDQTMAQIQWLQKYAAGAVSYEVNAQAYAAGNVKKGKKLDFFIK